MHVIAAAVAGTVIALLALPAPAQDAERIAEIREALEAPLREQAGVGFREFDCRLPSGVELPGVLEFTCSAVDEDGDRHLYRLWRDADNPDGVVSQWQPVEQLPDAVRAPLVGAADAFLDAFSTGDWERLAQIRHPALIELQSREAMQANLAAVREKVGAITRSEATLYNAAGPGIHAIEFRLEAEHGPLLARLQLRGDQALGMAISGYLIEPEAGTQLALAMLRERASTALAPLIGAPIVDLEVDLQELAQAGDSTIGRVRQLGGPQLFVLVSRIGTRFDFDNNDFRFSILEVPWMIARQEVQQGRGDSRVECPTRVAPDGGSIVCTVTRTDGSAQLFRVERRGGEHRMLPLDATPTP